MNGTSRAILDAARDLFAERGFEGTAVSDIAGVVGVADGAIYKHFPSKRAVLFEVIREFYEPVIDASESSLAGIDGIRNQLRYLIWLQLRAFAEEPEVCRLIIAEARPMEDYYQSEIAELNRRWTSLFVGVVSEGQATGDIRDDFPASLVRDLVYGGIEHIAWAATSGHGSIDPDRMADDLMRLVCEGLQPPPSSEDLDARVSRIEALLAEAER